MSKSPYRAPLGVGSPLAYRPDIDGLRAVAVLSVVAFHSSSRLPGGFVGVDIFFVVSGFLITGLVQADLLEGSFRISNFYARRVRRIVPALLLVLVATLAIGWWVLLTNEYLQLGRHVIAAMTFSSNLLLWHESGYFDASSWEKPLLHLWSLGIEEQFYLVWPLALVSMARWRHRNRCLAVGLAIAASFALDLWLESRDLTSAFYSPLSRAWELLTGSLLALLSGEMVSAAGALLAGQPRATWKNDLMSIVGASGIASACVLLSSASPFPGWRAIVPVAGTVLIVLAGHSACVNRLLVNRLAVLTGLISYPLYLWHWPLLTFARFLVVQSGSELRLMLLAADCLAVCLAVVTYRYLELPTRREDATRVAPRLLAYGTLVIAAGIAILLSSGVSSRQALAENPMVGNDVMSTPGCEVFYPKPPGVVRDTWCLRRGSGGAPGTVVIGDSHARALWAGIQADPLAKDALIIGGAGCPFLRHVRVWSELSPERRSDCPLVMSRAYGVLAGGPKTVVLHARMAMYFTRVGFGEAETALRNPGTIRVEAQGFMSTNNKLLLQEALVSDLRSLVDQRQRVIILLQVPELGFDIRPCVRIRPYERFVRRELPRCTVLRSVVEQRQASYRDAVTSAVHAVNSDHVQVIDPMKVLCDARECFSVRDGQPLYQDNDHLSATGSRFVWSHVAPLIR